MEELFIYLGHISYTHFFIHTQYAKNIQEDEIEQMSSQIYNMMIHETMIKINDKVCIFNVDINKNFVHVVITNHFTFKETKYDKESLKLAFKRLIQAKRSEIMTIKYDGEKYLLYEFPGQLPATDKSIVDNIFVKSDINKISYNISIKPIDYI